MKDVNVWIFLIGEGIAVVGWMLAFYTSVKTKLKELDIRIMMMEKQDDTIARKLEDLQHTVNAILVELQGKQDK